MKYLKKFTNTSDYEAFKGGGEYITPNVSYIEGSNEVLFNPNITLGADIFKAKFYSTEDYKMPFNSTCLFSELKIDGEDIECLYNTKKYSFVCDSSLIDINSKTIPTEYLTNQYKQHISYTIKPLNIIDNIDLNLLKVIEVKQDVNDYITIYDTENYEINDDYSIKYKEEFNAFTKFCLLLSYNGVIINTINEYEYFTNRETENTIECLASEINLVLDSDSGNLIGTAPSEYFVNNPSSVTLKSLDSSLETENAYICLLVNAPEMGGVIGLPLPIMTALEEGYYTYNEEENSITATDMFLQLLQSEMPYPFCAVLATVNEETGEPTFYDTINESVSSPPTEVNISSSEVKIINKNTIIVPSNYYFNFPTYCIFKLNESITDFTNKCICLITDTGHIDYFNNIENMYNSTNNTITFPSLQIILMFLLGDESDLFYRDSCCFLVCEITENKEIVKVYDTINITDGIQNPIFNYEFKNEGLHEIEFKMLNTICSPSFENKRNLIEISFPNKNLMFTDKQFRNCINLKKVTLPDNIISNGDGMFCNCSSLESIKLPNNITGLYAFGNFNFYCYGYFEGAGITTITIPNSVVYIGYNAFGYCKNLTSIKCEGNIAPDIIKQESDYDYVYAYPTFEGLSEQGTLYYPAGSDYSTWKEALPSGWTYVEF